MVETKRVKELRNYMSNEGIDVSLIFEPDNQYYISGFKAITYSRPIVTVVTMDRLELIAPGLESEHTSKEAKVDEVYIYHEIPEMAHEGISHTHYLEKILGRFETSCTIGVEKTIISASYQEYLVGMGHKVKDVGNKVFTMRYIKDEEELEFLRIAGMLSDVGVAGSLENALVGMNELEFENVGDAKMQSYIKEHLNNSNVGYENWTNSGIDRTVMPHLYSNSRKLEKNDVITHSRQVWLNGYRAENERTFFLGKPTDRQMDIFKMSVDSQQAGIDKIRAGVTAKEVDLASRAVFEKYDIAIYANHRTGHGLGLSEHEEPYLRFDNELILEPGMVFTVEPGIYIPGIGGFRHSDTLIVTETGCELITKYERAAEKLIFDC